MSCYDGKGRVRRLERIQEKWVPVFHPNARQNKDLEHVSDFIFCECALDPVHNSLNQGTWSRFVIGRAFEPKNRVHFL